MALLNLRRVGVRNFRCFGDEEQSGRLAPLTLLVGDNSTGKTSFMAMIRLLWNVACRNRVADFKEEPYDLGSFDDIIHCRDTEGSATERIEVSFEAFVSSQETQRRTDDNGDTYYFSAAFERGNTAPTLVRRRFVHDIDLLEEFFDSSGLRKLCIRTARGSWKAEFGHSESMSSSTKLGWYDSYSQYRIGIGAWSESAHWIDQADRFAGIADSPEITSDDHNEIGKMQYAYFARSEMRPYASAPVRFKPRRTYDPAHVVLDPEGDYIPMYLAELNFHNQEDWRSLKKRLERFGRNSGLFDEIRVRRLGKRASEPFQLQVRKSGGKRLKGPWYNLMDVGYGVSQALPLITELLRDGSPDMFLLQQPEVHLHPSAQAALGSLLGNLSVEGKQIILETHSDHLIDRVRMDVRDKKSGLTPEHVSILYFERRELDVYIYSLKLDEVGNLWQVGENGDLVHVPASYRRFFMEETRRSLGF